MTHRMTRKQFGSAVLGGTVLLWIQSCGGGGGDGYGSSGSGPTSGNATGCSDTIADNHGHVLVIATADLDSTTDKTYDIHGTADHTHSVTLTAADLAKLKSHTTVNVSSTITLSHAHAITVTCM